MRKKWVLIGSITLVAIGGFSLIGGFSFINISILPPDVKTLLTNITGINEDCNDNATSENDTSLDDGIKEEALQKINSMEENGDNKGIIQYVNSLTEENSNIVDSEIEKKT